MVVYIIITLIVALIVIGVWVNAVQQHKEKQNAERRQELTKQKKIATLLLQSKLKLLNSRNGLLMARLRLLMKNQDTNVTNVNTRQHTKQS